jgi:hypothetical protein
VLRGSTTPPGLLPLPPYKRSAGRAARTPTSAEPLATVPNFCPCADSFQVPPIRRAAQMVPTSCWAPHDKRGSVGACGASLLLLSRTRAVCLRGLRSRRPDARVCGKATARRRLPDLRVMQFWDKNRLISHSMGQHDLRSEVWITSPCTHRVRSGIIFLRQRCIMASQSLRSKMQRAKGVARALAGTEASISDHVTR